MHFVYIVSNQKLILKPCLRHVVGHFGGIERRNGTDFSGALKNLSKGTGKGIDNIKLLSYSEDKVVMQTQAREQ